MAGDSFAHSRFWGAKTALTPESTAQEGSVCMRYLFLLLFSAAVIGCSNNPGGNDPNNNNPENCDPGQSLCDGACIPTTDDPNNCGGCDIQCSGGQLCQNSDCVDPACGPGQDFCGGACIPTTDDPNN